MRTIDDVFKMKWNLNYPKALQIETISTCNSHCSFCPYDKTSKIFPKSEMSDKLFYTILNQLEEFQPLLIAPYMNNEPLLDKIFFERIGALRNFLPDTYIDIATNGSLLTEDKAEKLISPEYHIDEIKINFSSVIKEEYEHLTGMNYDINIRNIISFIQIANNNFKGRYRIIIVGSSHPETDKNFWQELGIEATNYNKLSRGGIIESKEPKAEINGCKYFRHNEWMHILSNGQVTLCCMDWYRNYILGNLNYELIHNVWNSKKYNNIRERVNKSIDKTFICNNCEWGLQDEG